MRRVFNTYFRQDAPLWINIQADNRPNSDTALASESVLCGVVSEVVEVGEVVFGGGKK